MALVVFLRGVNVGGHRRFRPSVVAEELRRFDVVNIGAAGTFVVRKPVSQARFRAELARCLPFETHVMICRGSDLLRLTSCKPFAGQPSGGAHIVPFVSVLAKRRQPSAALPQRFPATGEWGLRIIGQQGRFVFGVYRREMKAIGHLAQLDRLFGVPVTTRSWNTMVAIARLLESSQGTARGATAAHARPPRRASAT
jgi:uncharacterized protein (DUF1697 family)